LYAAAGSEWADLSDVGAIGKGEEKGKRGALIMAAERNKKALENGTYGNGYVQGAYTLGVGACGRAAPPDATVAAMRLFKLERNGGRSLHDEELGEKAASDMAAANAARTERRGGSTADPRIVAQMRAGRLSAMRRNATFAEDERRKDAVAKAAGTQRLPSDAAAAAAVVKVKNAALDMRFKRLELCKALGVAATRKRARPESVVEDALKEQALLGGLSKVVVDPAELARRKERMLAARKRKLMDFLPGSKGKPGGGQSAEASAAAAASRNEQPLGGGGKGGKKPAMSAADAAEEAEMLAILKGINTSSSDKFSGGFQAGPDQSNGASKPARPQVKDYKKTADIAKARLLFMADGGNPEFEP
jgi:hypothetical protein